MSPTDRRASSPRKVTLWRVPDPITVLTELSSSSIQLDRAVEGFLRRDRYAVIGASIVLTALAWGYLALLVGEMEMTFSGGMEQMQSMMALRP